MQQKDEASELAHAAKARSDKIVSELHEKTTEEVKTMYDTWSGNYEQDLLNMTHGYSHPQKIAKVAAAHLPDKGCRILDVCAGTGLGGLALQQLGFINIDAIDGSRGMLDVAAQKQVYRQLFLELIGSDSIESVQQGSYDAVVTSGSFLPGHLGPMHLRPLIGVLKSGGLFCMALREEYLLTDYLRSLEPVMDQLESDGIWRREECGIMDHYYNDLPGKYYVYRRA